MYRWFPAAVTGSPINVVLACCIVAGNGTADVPGQLLRDPGRDAAGRAAAQRHVGVTDGVQCRRPGRDGYRALVIFFIFSSSAGFCRDRNPWLQPVTAETIGPQ